MGEIQDFESMIKKIRNLFGGKGQIGKIFHGV